MQNEVTFEIRKPNVLTHKSEVATKKSVENHLIKQKLPEILFVTSYPPRECGIATYSQDLIKALNNKYRH